VWVAADAAAGGASIAGEVWRLSADGFARFTAGLATPMAIGRVPSRYARNVQFS
jgi:allophanate hydrolase